MWSGQELSTNSARLLTRWHFTPGVSNHWHLTPDGLSWSWCNNHRKKCTENVTRFNCPESVGFPSPILGKIVFHETDLWAQRGWGPLHYTVYLHKGVRNWGLGSVEEESNSWTVRTSQLGAGMEEVKRAPGTGVVPSLGSIRHVWKPAWEEPGNQSGQEGRTSPQKQSHSPRAKSSADFFAQYFIYSALGSISPWLLFHKAET